MSNPMLFVIFGASGSGKTTFLQLIKEHFPHVSLHIKGTTRNLRQYDAEEIESYPSGFPNNKYDYVYSQYGYDYGIEKRQIDQALLKNEKHFVICNDLTTIAELRKCYVSKIKVVFLIFDMPLESIIAVQKTRQISDDEISVRIQKIQYLNHAFTEHPELFDEVVKNTYGMPPSRMISQMEKVLFQDATQSMPSISISHIQNILEIITKNQAHQNNQHTIQKDFLFIIMAMRENTPELDDFHDAVKGVATDFKLRAERVDDTFGFTQINQKILKHIELAEYIVADLTFERPNCYYEIGYAHALNKKVILTAKRGSKVHFDIASFPVIFYAGVADLKKQLRRAFDSSSVTAMRG